MDIKRPVVTLITDFGTADGYVGAMKGVLLSTYPLIWPVDITHDIPRHDVYRGGLACSTRHRSSLQGRRIWLSSIQG